MARDCRNFEANPSLYGGITGGCCIEHTLDNATGEYDVNFKIDILDTYLSTFPKCSWSLSSPLKIFRVSFKDLIHPDISNTTAYYANISIIVPVVDLTPNPRCSLNFKGLYSINTALVPGRKVLDIELMKPHLELISPKP